MIKMDSIIHLDSYRLISDRLSDVLSVPALARAFKHRDDCPTDAQLSVISDRVHELVMLELSEIIRRE